MQRSSEGPDAWWLYRTTSKYARAAGPRVARSVDRKIYWNRSLAHESHRGAMWTTTALGRYRPRSEGTRAGRRRRHDSTETYGSSRPATGPESGNDGRQERQHDLGCFDYWRWARGPGRGA